MTMNYDQIWEMASEHWPAMVNIERTKLMIVNRPRTEREREENWIAADHFKKMQLRSPGSVVSTEYDLEDVGPYQMAYDPVLDLLFVMDDE